MAIQSEFFSTSFGIRSFSSTKYIATKQHMAVWLKRVSDDLWTQLSVNKFELINNSAVLTESPSSILYSQVEIRVADEPDELGSSQSDIAVVASIATQLQEIVDTVVPNLPEILLADDNAITATTQAGIATTQAGVATTKASEASASATSASNSETTATTKASEASASATSASNSATTATTKANEASASASLALTSANNASTSETMAYKWSSNPVDAIVETDKYSAFHWATKAQQYASSVDPSNLVHKNGDETITGIKTFSFSPIVPTPVVGDNSTKVATTAFVKSKSEADSIGVGQTWQNVTTSRNAGVTYTNTTGKPITVSIRLTSGSATSSGLLEIDGVDRFTVSENITNFTMSVVGIVPNGSTYKLTTNSSSITTWNELR